MSSSGFPFRSRFLFTHLLAALAGAWAFSFYRNPPRAALDAPAASAVYAVVPLDLTSREGGLFSPDVSRLPSVPVLHVVDGDTIQVFWEGRPQKVRYYGVNTPEKNKPCYDEATQRNRELAGGSVRLAFDERPRDAYGRLLAYAFTEQGLSIDAQLTAEGWGRAWKRDGRFREEISGLEDRARAAREGCLWDGKNEESPAPRKPRKRKSRP